MEPIQQLRQYLTQMGMDPDADFMDRRKAAEGFEQAFTPPEGVKLEQATLAGLKVEWSIPDGAPASPVLLHFHGGGYVMGEPSSSRGLTTEIAKRAKIRVVSVDYALAPEVPFPGAVNDAVKAYRALLDQGIAPGAISIAGEFAGGGLVVAMLLGARDAGLPMPACAVAISPWTDLTCDTPTYKSKHGIDPMLTQKSILGMAKAYLAGTDPRHPLASPNYADLKGLPPLLIHVGTDEVLLDDARVLDERAKKAGVDSRLEIWDKMVHVWHMFHALLPQGSEAIDGVIKFLNEHTKDAQRSLKK